METSLLVDMRSLQGRFRLGKDEAANRPRKGRQVKQKVSRVRSGCTTCKIRKIKCDETKPACLRCQEAKQPCGGYQIPATVYFQVYNTPQEIRGHQFFREKVAPELADFSSENFWKNDVAQLAYLQPVARHLVIAIGAYCDGLERLYDVTDAKLIQNDPAAVVTFEHYHRAIALLRASPRLEIEALTAVVLLLIYLMQLMGEYGSAFRYVIMALQGMPQIKQILSDGGGEFESTLMARRILRRVKSQYTQFFDCIGPEFGLVTHTFDPSAGCYPLPTTFRTLVEAQDYLEVVMTQIWHSYKHQHQGGPHRISDHEALIQPNLTILSKWVNALEALMANGLSNRKSASRLTYLGLRIRAELLEIMILTIPFDDEAIFDSYEHKFSQINDFARSYLDICGRPTISAQLYGMESNLLWPLSLTATLCRHPRIRRSALELLRKYARQEGPWDSKVAASMNQLIVEEEERGLVLDDNSTGRDIPSSNRMRWLNIHYRHMQSEQKEAYIGIEYVKSPFDVVSGPREFIWIPWTTTNLSITDKLNPEKYDRVPTSKSTLMSFSKTTSTLSCGCVTRYLHIG